MAIRKANREHEKECAEAKKALELADKQITSMLSEFRSDLKLRSRFKGEMRVLDNRLKCVQLILNGPILTLQQYIKGFSEAAIETSPAKSSAASTADSRSMQQVAGAPPFNGYEKLLTYDEVVAEAVCMDEVKTAAQLETEVNKLKSRTAVLMDAKSAAIVAKDDLAFAKTQWEKAEKAEQTKIAAADAKAKRQAAAGGTANQSKPQAPPYIYIYIYTCMYLFNSLIH